MKSLKESILDVDDNIEDQTSANLVRVKEWLAEHTNVRIDEPRRFGGSLATFDPDTKLVTITIGNLVFEDDDNEPYSIPTDLFRFNEFKGYINASYCNLTTLEGLPKIAYGNFDLEACEHLKNLKGCPQEVTGSFNIAYCEKLESLEGGPVKVANDYVMNNCTKLKSFKGLAPEIGRDLYAQECANIVDFNIKMKSLNSAYFNGCKKLKIIKGLPDKDMEDLYITDCISLTDLTWCPTELFGTFNMNYCKNIANLKGAPIYIGGSWCFNACPKLKDPSNWFNKMEVFAWYDTDQPNALFDKIDPKRLKGNKLMNTTL